MEGGKTELTTRVTLEFKKELEGLAKKEGMSISKFVRKALEWYIREYYYQKLQTYYNFEDLTATSILMSLAPKLEKIEKNLEEIRKKINWSNRYEDKEVRKKRRHDNFQKRKGYGEHTKDIKSELSNRRKRRYVR